MVTSTAAETIGNDSPTDKGSGDITIIATLSKSGLINIPKSIRGKLGILDKTQKVEITMKAEAGTIIMQLLDLVPMRTHG